MTVEEALALFGEGLPADQLAILRSSLEREGTKAKLSGVKQQSEYDTLARRNQEMQLELEGDAAQGKLGAREFAKWYEANRPAIARLQEDNKKYADKYGSLDTPNNPNPNPTNPSGTTFTKDDIIKIANDHIQNTFGGRWSELMKSQSKILQKHFLAGRKTEVDIDKLAETANQKYAGNLELAYDEWDKPERDKQSKAEEEKRIEARVNEELQKRGAGRNFPGGADMSTPGALASKPQADRDKFDKTALMNDLAKDWDTAGSVKQ